MCAGATEECIQRIGQEKAAERKGILKKREEGLVRTDKIQALAQSIPNQTLGDFRMESIPLCGKLCLSATLGVMIDRSQYFGFTAPKVNREAVLDCR